MSTVDGLQSYLALDSRVCNDNPMFEIPKPGTRIQHATVKANSASKSNVQFNVITPSKDHVIDKRAWLKLKYKFKGTKATAHSQPLLDVANVPPHGNILVSNTDGLAFLPFQSRCCRNLAVVFNNTTFNMNPSDVLEPLCRYGYELDDIENFYSGGPFKHDQFADAENFAALGSARCANAPYGGSEICPRGSLKYTIISNTTTEFEVDCEWYEPVLMSPFSSDRCDQKGFLGITNMDFTFSLDGDLTKMWSHDAVSAGWGFGSGAAPNDCSLVVSQVDQPTLLLTYITSPLLARNSLSNHYPYFDIIKYTSVDVGSVASGGSKTFDTNNIQLPAVPRRIYLYAREQDSDRSPNSTDHYGAITGVDIQFNNLTGIMAGADSFKLWQMSSKSGLKMPYPAWRHWVGSPLCIDFGKNMPLEELVSIGMSGQYGFSARVTVENITKAAKNYQLYIVVVHDSSMSIIGQSVNRKQSGGVVPSNLFSDMDNIQTISSDPSRTFYGAAYTGGSLWSWIKKMASKAHGAVDKALPYVEKALPYVKKSLPIIASLLAAGYQPQEVEKAVNARYPELSKKQIQDMLAAGGAYSGGGVKTQSDCRGGRRTSRSDLRRRM